MFRVNVISLFWVSYEANNKSCAFLISYLTRWTVSSLNLFKQASCFGHFPLKATVCAFPFFLLDL